MSNTQAKDCYLGVDLGGTKILAGVFSPKLELLGCAKTSTKADRGADAVVERIVHCVLNAVDECDLRMEQITAVGVGAPGAVDPETGTVIFAPNLGWKGIALEKALRHKLAVPVFIANDCNASALGVYKQELSGKPRHLLGIFIGTGIGAGLIINRELHLGHNFTAGEVGHMVLELNGPRCNCGKQGCFEALSSRTALFRKIHAAVKEGHKTVLTEMLGSNLENLRSGDLRRAIRRGDKLVQKIVDEAAVFAGIAVGNLINVFSPDVVALGGGVIEALGDEMMPTIDRVAREHVLEGTMKDIQILASHLGDNAGITGAAVWAQTRVQ